MFQEEWLGVAREHRRATEADAREMPGANGVRAGQDAAAKGNRRFGPFDVTAMRLAGACHAVRGATGAARAVQVEHIARLAARLVEESKRNA